MQQQLTNNIDDDNMAVGTFDDLNNDYSKHRQAFTTKEIIMVDSKGWTIILEDDMI